MNCPGAPSAQCICVITRLNCSGLWVTASICFNGCSFYSVGQSLQQLPGFFSPTRPALISFFRLPFNKAVRRAVLWWLIWLLDDILPSNVPHASRGQQLHGGRDVRYITLSGTSSFTGQNIGSRQWVQVCVWDQQRSGPSFPVSSSSSSSSLDSYFWQKRATAGARKRPGGFGVVLDVGHRDCAKDFVPG